jgi:hypothetical protein
MTANDLVDLPSLRVRFTADRETEQRGQDGVVEDRLARALDTIGWRSAGGESSAEVAALARHVVASCVTDHHDPRRAARELAELLRSSTTGLDGSLPPASAFVPAGEQLLRRYVGAPSARREGETG